MRSMAIFFLVWSGLARAAGPVCEPISSTHGNELGFGVEIQLLLPSQLPEFVTSTPTVGPLLVIPWNDLAIVTSFGYGPAGDVNAYFLESSLRVPLPTPFLPFYVLVGGQFLHYSAPIASHNFVGLHFGPAMVLAMSKSLDIQFGLKIYLQSSLMSSFSGNLIFRL